MFNLFGKDDNKKDKYVPESYIPGKNGMSEPLSTERKSKPNSKVHMITAEHGDEMSQEIRKYVSQQVQDPFSGNYDISSDGQSDFSLIEPWFLPQSLNSLVNTNAMLKQCVTATVTNVAGNGFYLKYIGPKEEKDDKKVIDKKNSFKDLLNRPNPETDGDTMFLAIAEDIVRNGYAYMEVARTPKGEVGYLYHIPASTVRKSKKERTPTTVMETIIRNGNELTVPYKRKFRRFGMRAGLELQTIYFKEFKDPRTIDKRSGRKANVRLARENLANELISFSPYEPNHVYPLPLWINQLPAILGSRLSEEVNLDFFESNAIPAMLLLVSGGALTEDSVNDLQKKFNSIKGQNSVQKILIVEAMGDDSAISLGGSVPPPKLEAKPMTHDRQNDSLFREYNKDNKESIQCAFRLPDVLLGKTADYNRATAYAAIIVAEAQVFNPIRRTIESVINRCILVDEKGLPDKHWKFVFKPTKLLNEETVFNAINNGIKSGAATPKDIADIIRDNFNIDIPVDEKDWANDVPSLGFSKGLEIMYNKLAEAGKIINVDIPEDRFSALVAPSGATGMPKDGIVTYEDESDILTTEDMTGDSNSTSNPNS